MAPEVENTYAFCIIPKNLSAVQIYVWYGETRLSYNINNCEIRGNYLYLDTYQGVISGTKPTAVEVSSSGYETVSIDNPTFNNYYNCYISLIPKLYAWEYDGTTIYTSSATPANGAYYYNNAGKPYDQYELVVGMYALYYCINSYNSANDTINISGDPA